MKPSILDKAFELANLRSRKEKVTKARIELRRILGGWQEKNELTFAEETLLMSKALSSFSQLEISREQAPKQEVPDAQNPDT